MPARPRTPSPGPDEPKYLTVVWPYPMHAHMELEGDVKQFVYWIASCIGSDPLLALFYKPSSPNMVIIEVSRDFDKWETLLGEHKWSEFLRNPTAEEMDKVSQIFYCTFNSGRQVQKHGWLRKDVESVWFKNWTRNNKIVIQPYPATCYCPTPSEDRTNAPLCRPLPVKSFPPPPAVRLPPVGSPEWLKLKEKEVNAPKMQGAWSKGAPGRASASGSSKAGPNRNVPILASGRVRSSAPVRNASSPAGPALPPGIMAPAPLAIPTPSNARQFSSAVSPSSASPNDSIPPPLTRGSSAASGSSSSGSGKITPGQSMDGGVSPEAFAHAMATLSVDSDLWEAGQDAIFDRPWNPDGFVPVDAPGVDELPPAQELIFEGYAYKEEDKGEKEPEPVCPAHGKLCKKGICTEYKAQKRKMKREKEDANKKAEMEKRGKTGNEKGKKREAAKPKYNMLPARNTPPPLTFPKAANSAPANAWGRPAATSLVSPLGASTPFTAAASVPTPAQADDFTAPQRPAKGRRMNTANTPVSPAMPINVLKAAGPPSAGVSTTGGWGQVSNGPWGGNGNNTKPIVKKAPSSVASSGWGTVSNGPWGSRAPSVNGYEDEDDARTVAGGDLDFDTDLGDQAVNKSWADQVEDEEDNRSVAASSTGGWGTVSDGPWK